MSLRSGTKLAVDVAMYALMLCLASYPVTRGLLRHGVCGCLLLVLFVGHHALNAGWYASLPKGRWTACRVLLTLTDTALLLAVLCLTGSALALAGEVFAFVPFPMAPWARGLHTAATAWCLVLVSVHLGLHGQRWWAWSKKLAGRAWPVLTLILLLVGGQAFVASGLWSDMLLLGEPRPRPASLEAFLGQSLAITLFFCLLARLLSDCLQGRRQRKMP